ncbi:hypothetical protein [Solidesulfovibrio carbinolicus]|uniref:Uncharacterized protein n=1 Tax=Solidesulfovibrio carbinolicus TaxID=296842 RepID=A0A4P6HPT5_9BACT|nr:hypothetical protein [Solidesulfovibrio carbinolicus]QAZ69321.1 hypothetical protein C3Y92_19595 [Solidesulfovibrio carbinolicus]
MSNVKKIVVASLAAAALFALFVLDRPSAGPAAPAPRGVAAPARADLAEAVFSMVLARAGEEGVPLSQPPSLCQACVAAHLGLDKADVRERCARACSLQ